MRWPWKQQPHVDDTDFREARKALAKARADEPRVASVVEDLQRKQDANHFGPRIHDALTRRPRREHP